jgi:chaperonin GroES
MADFKLQPLEDRIVVQANEGDQTTASGLVIPDTAKEKPQEGTVGESSKKEGPRDGGLQAPAARGPDRREAERR